jgi:hypothetical protein
MAEYGCNRSDLNHKRNYFEMIRLQIQAADRSMLLALLFDHVENADTPNI